MNPVDYTERELTIASEHVRRVLTTTEGDEKLGWLQTGYEIRDEIRPRIDLRKAVDEVFQ